MRKAVPRLRGPLFQSRFKWVRRHHGAEGVARVMNALPAEDREALEGLEADGWYPLSTFLSLDRTLLRLYGNQSPDLSEELGATSARARLAWLREHAPLISVHALLARSAEEHGWLADFGNAVYRRRAFTEGTLELSGFPQASELFCRSFRGYVAEIVRLHGAVGPVVEETECQALGAQRCSFVVRWLSPGSDSSGVGGSAARG